MSNIQTALNYGTTQSVDRWGIAARVFHWISALLLVITWLFVFLHHNVDDPDHTYIMWHRSLGLLFLVWVAGRLSNRFRIQSNIPPQINTIIWQKHLANAVHILLYIAMFGMPITGLIMTLYGGKDMLLFGVIDIPPLFDQNKSVRHIFHDLHTDLIWTMLWSLSAVHILSALYHQFIRKDKLINRML